jgi:hypothetical protein
MLSLGCYESLEYQRPCTFLPRLLAGDVPLDGRRQAIAQFAEGSGDGEPQPLLICTDLAARCMAVGRSEGSPLLPNTPQSSALPMGSAAGVQFHQNEGRVLLQGPGYAWTCGPCGQLRLPAQRSGLPAPHWPHCPCRRIWQHHLSCGTPRPGARLCPLCLCAWCWDDSACAQPCVLPEDITPTIQGKG